MPDTITRTQSIFVQDCCECFMPFGVPASFDAQRHKDKKSFCCPAGHWQSYVGKSDEQIAREERTRREEAERLAASQAEEARIQAARAAKAETEAARLRQRAKGGACPCCNRSFVQLARHIKTKHPEFDQASASEA